MQRTISRTLRILLPLLVLMAASLTVAPSAGAAVTVTGKFSDGSLLAAGTPTYRLAAGNAYAVGDYVVLMVAQNAHAAPGAVTDSLGNAYRPLDGDTGYNSATDTPLPLGFALYGSLITVAGSRPTLHFTLSSTGMFGLRDYTGASQAPGLHGFPMAMSNEQIAARTASPYPSGAAVFDPGDLIAACIVALSPTVTLAKDPASSPGWNEITNFSGNGITLQLLEQSPAAPDFYLYEWDTSPDVTAVFTAYGIRHA